MGLSDQVAPTLINGIPTWEEDPQETTDRRGSMAVRTIVCLWEDRWKLATYFRGGVVTIGGVIIYTNPQVYPWANWLYCQDVEMAPQHGKGGTVTDTKGMFGAKYARLKVNYRDLETSDTGSTGLEFGSEIQSIQGSTLKFADGANEPVPGTWARRIPVVNISWQKTGVANLPTAAFFAAAQAPLNSASIFGIPAGYVLFDGGRAFKRFTSAGATGWDVQINFSARGVQWDYSYDHLGVSRRVIGAGGATMIPTSDLNALLI